jgi:flagellar motility protein MotE (MotC chaperone)
MKKLLIVIQVVILILIIVKVATVVGLPKKIDILPDASLMANNAIAQQNSANPVPEGTSAPAVSATTSAPIQQAAPPAKENTDDNLTKQRDLASALLAKKIELDNRDNALRAEEQRLLTLRKEITDKITLLKSQEEKLTAIIEATQTSEVKRYKEMAKVYEATPPAKAGSMLEKLDTKTAAGITMNMKKDKAGAIWGFISPQKAVEITKEITKAGGNKLQTE